MTRKDNMGMDYCWDDGYWVDNSERITVGRITVGKITLEYILYNI